MTEANDALLHPDEPPVVSVLRPGGRSPFVLACDHAGNVLPRRLGTLGLAPEHLTRHIAWDIGAAGVARRLAERFDAATVMQHYSRLVIDCNRNPEISESSIPTISEDTEIPGNRELSPAQREARIGEIFRPYHERLGALLDARDAAGQPSVLVAMHSFTPVFKGFSRPWHISVLYNRDPRLPSLLLDELRAEPDLCVGDNEPYFVSDENDYTIPVHGEGRGIPHVEIEVRQDLIADEAGQDRWAERLAGWLARSLERLDAAR